MRPRRDPVPRARDAWVWLGGLALLGILGGGVTAAAVLLWESIDIRQLAPRLAAPQPPAPPPTAPSPGTHPEIGFSAVVFDSERNRAFFPDAAYQPRELAAWTALLEDAGGVVRRARDGDALHDVAAHEVLVLVEAPCLSDGEIAAVRAHLRRGGSVVANWALGARDGSCAWRGWQTVAEVTGAEDVREIPARSGLFLAVPAGIPLSPGFDPGTRIELAPDPSIALRTSGPRAYWSDWSLNPAPDESGGAADAAAVATRTSQGGRVAWFGLRLGQGASPADGSRLRQLFVNGILWAAGTPVAAPAPWPDGRRAAAVFSVDVEDDARNALGVADLLRERRLPGTFYVVTGAVQGDSALAAGLARAGEVGSQTSDHMPVAGLTARDQAGRLQRSRAEVEAWVGRPAAGIHPPEESFDALTLTAWAAAGGRYILATNDARSAAPELHRTPEGPVVLLPRLLKDDYNIVVQDRVLRATGLAQAMHAGVRKVRAIGGLAIVATHTQIMRPGPRLEALASVMDSVRAQGDWWVASGGDVADWWLARSEARVRFASLEDGAGVTPTLVSRTSGTAAVAEILVEGSPRRNLDGLWIDVVLPTGPEGVYPLLDGRPIDFVVTEWGVRIPIEELGAGVTRRISLVLEDESPPELLAP